MTDPHPVELRDHRGRLVELRDERGRLVYANRSNVGRSADATFGRSTVGLPEKRRLAGALPIGMASLGVRRRRSIDPRRGAA